MATGLFVGGQWRDGSGQTEVTNKYSGKVIGHVATAGPNNIELALASAKKGADDMAALPAHRRYDILSRTSRLIAERQELLSTTIAAEAGKPLKFALAEVERATNTFQLAAEEARRIHGETIALDAVPNGENYFGFWWRKPVGVVAAITPFNFPLNLVAHKLAPAIAAGNAYLHKPADYTPLTAVLLMEILLEAGLPPEAAQLVPGSGKVVGAAIVKDPRVHKVTFTGSAEVGQQILSTAGIKKVTLELGNSSPVIVAGDADLAFAAQRCAIGAFAHSGQVCNSVQRIYVEQTVEQEFRELLIKATEALKVGDPLDKATDVGPMISEKEAERIESWVTEAEQGGATRLVGGQRDRAVYYPTILNATTPEMKVNAHEVFAPVATLNVVPNFDTALKAANATSYGLQASVFTSNIDRVLSAIHQLDFGGVIINDMPGFRVDHMPYGGNKQSGLGREGLRFAIEEMTNIQTVAIRSSRR